MNRYLAELFGTFVLVFIGLGSIVTGGFGSTLPLGQIGIGLSFGIALIAMAYTVGPVSGAHLNPAVTIGAWLADRFPVDDVAPYIIAQIIGAALGAGAIYALVSSGTGGYDIAKLGLGQNSWDPNLYGAASIFAFEVVGTFIFVTVILAVTGGRGETAVAGLVIGLTLAALHFAFIPVSGNSLNPARSLGPALFVGGSALQQIWLYALAPLLGGALAGLVAKYDLPDWALKSRPGKQLDGVGRKKSKRPRR
jgi:aquaporin Z